MINIAGIDKAQLLLALWRGATQLEHCPPREFTLEWARRQIEHDSVNFFSTVVGRRLMVHLDGGHLRLVRGRSETVPVDTLDETLYDQMYGPGAAQRAVDAARNA